eukprot:1158509-Pelagomonas_calceolata.AAC.8
MDAQPWMSMSALRCGHARTQVHTHTVQSCCSDALLITAHKHEALYLETTPRVGTLIAPV